MDMTDRAFADLCRTEPVRTEIAAIESKRASAIGKFWLIMLAGIALDGLVLWLVPAIAMPPIQRGGRRQLQPPIASFSFWKKPFEAGHSSPVSVSRKASRISRCLAVSLVGVSTSTWMTMSP
jgi:hypothetical protein